jgi:hypothetical protein
MVLKIWVDQDVQSGEFWIYDHDEFYGDGPIEISNELHERIHEAFKEYQVIQDILESLVYNWKHPESPEIDCG